jgi:rod shape determining protein RodA
MATNKSGSPRLWGNFDWPFFGTILFFCLIGLMTLHSSTYRNQSDIFYKQLLFVAGGLAIALLITLIDYRIFERLAYIVYVVVILLLILVYIKGKSALGAQRWIPLGPIHLQPSELAKISVVFVLAKFYSGERVGLIRGYGFKELIPIMAMVFLPFVLVLKQPDLGSALMIAFVAFTVVFFCNLRVKTLIGFIVALAIAAPVAYKFLLKDFQRGRVETFLDPTQDPLKGGYQALQSMITVGSGQFFGKGYLHGTQSKLDFLPKHHTDFIFSTFAEEWGFLGSLALIVAFSILLLLGIDICKKSKDKFGSVLGMGALSIIMWHVIVNMGMEIGLLPVVGVTFPFFSYGGSSLITNMCAAGLLLSISLRRHIF